MTPRGNLGKILFFCNEIHVVLSLTEFVSHTCTFSPFPRDLFTIPSMMLISHRRRFYELEQVTADKVENAMWSVSGQTPLLERKRTLNDSLKGHPLEISACVCIFVCVGVERGEVPL